MKVVKLGNAKEYFHECDNCKSELLYTIDDVHKERVIEVSYDMRIKREMSCIVCPVCEIKQFVSFYRGK